MHERVFSFVDIVENLIAGYYNTESPLLREASWLALIRFPMQSPMFTPLQPRFVSSSTVTLFLTLFSFISLIPHFAHATDADSIAHDDHNHPRIRDLQDQSGVSGTLELIQEERSLSYEPIFSGLDRSILGRAYETRPLKINNSTTDSIKRGDTHSWKVQSAPDARNLARASLSHGEENNGDFHELLKRQDRFWMNISLSICDISNTGSDMPPALRLNISSPDSETPLDSITTVRGFANTYVEVISYIKLSVYVDESSEFEGTYTYELTTSMGVHEAGIIFLDSDNNSTLLASEVNPNLNSIPHGYGVFVHPDDSLISWISNSTCALNKLGQINGNSSNDPITANVTTGMTMPNLRGGRKQLFHVTGLNPHTSYWAIMATGGDSTQRFTSSGFELVRPVKFTTKSDGNCAVIYNLSFCANASYAVPYNPNTYPNFSALASFYDNRTEELYKNFTFSLEQIPCNTTSSAKYSLARDCDDCDAAYRSWLCAVTIPRCGDFSAGQGFARSVSQPFWNNTTPSGIDMDDAVSKLSNQSKSTNSSRNPMIDQNIKPGPWREVLPCEDLCYQLVQSCPAALDFACPTGKMLEYSYGKPGQQQLCNDPTKWELNAAGRGVGRNFLGLLAAFGLILILQLGEHF
ncbi:stretch-activated cation channel mid1 [Sticta canariensis]|nr:stretch-activated cation channel mid1 [Sticta canariensis]